MQFPDEFFGVGEILIFVDDDAELSRSSEIIITVVEVNVFTGKIIVFLENLGESLWIGFDVSGFPGEVLLIYYFK